MKIDNTQIDTGRPILHDHATGREIRNATPEELAASIEATEHDGGYGIIEVGGVDCFVSD